MCVYLYNKRPLNLPSSRGFQQIQRIWYPSIYSMTHTAVILSVGVLPYSLWWYDLCNDILRHLWLDAYHLIRKQNI